MKPGIVRLCKLRQLCMASGFIAVSCKFHGQFQGFGWFGGPGYETGHETGMLYLRSVILHCVWFHAGFMAVSWPVSRVRARFGDRA